MAAKTSSSAASSSTPQWKYDVFLSFRGEDTRRGFTDHLYRALDKKGICTYRDDEKLERGKTIRPELLKAIEESRFAVVVFSRDYASSTWCLDEVSKIAECMKGTGQTVIPIFYHVEPSEIRKQKGAFEKAFAEHEEVFKNNLGKVNKWREALTEIADVSGWDLQHRHESAVINEIVKTILNKLNLSSSTVDDDLVGMDCRMEKILSQLDIGRSDDVRVVGIWGMPGIGKTTLAQQVLGKIGDQFEACCCVPNIREESDKHGLIHLQKLLLSFLLESEANIQSDRMGINIIRDRLRHRKVLIILDDVDDFKQLEALAGKGDLGGPGSRVIVTTRDKQVLKKSENVYICEVDKLTTEEALKLFRNKAFKNNRNADEYRYESKEVVKYADGLPLALEVLGSFLHGRTQEEWSDTLARLKEYPEKGIMVPLRVSYDGLSESEKKTFLDIACFFKGEDEFRVKKILKECDGVYQGIDIPVLKEKSLITIVGGKIWMHDLLQELGRQIVRGEPPEEPGKRSRLSLHKDVLEVLEENSGTKAVEGILLITPKKEEVRLDVDPFQKMSKLRLLKILNVKISGCVGYLSNELRLLEWHRCPLTSMPSSFQPNKLVELNLSNSCIKQLWEESKDLPNLVVINLTNCHLLMKTPDLSKIRNLEKLILKGCRNLSEVDTSIRDLKKLVFLNLEGCESLEKLPDEISLESLEALNLSGCSKLKKFPEIGGKMEKLSELYLTGTAIAELPMSIEHLTGLILLNLKDCKNLLSLPDVICSLTSLRTLTLSGCSHLDQLPNNLGSLECLKELDASNTSIRKVPSSIRLLKNLETLSLRGCKGHMSLPNRSIWQSLFCCCLLPSEGSESASSSLELPLSFTGLFSLKTLDLSQCNLPERGIPNDLGRLSLLEKLDLSENNFRSVPQSIFQLSNLRELGLNRCNQLESLPSLPPSIKLVIARECANLRNSNKYTVWTSKKGLCLIDCRKSGEDKGPTFHKIPIAEEHVHLQLQNFIEDEVRQGKGFDHAFPCTGIPNWCSDNKADGFSIIIELPPKLDMIEWMGFALCIVYMSQKQEKSDPPPPGDSIGCDITEFSCRFETVEGPLENSLDFQVFIDRCGGSFGHCKYIPREWFAGQLDKASQVEVSISINSQEVEVTMCGAHIIYEQNVTKFVQNLFQPSEQAMALASHYQQIVDHVSKSAIIDEIDSIIGERKFIDEIEEQQRECASAETSQETEEDSISLYSFLINIEAQTDRHRSSTNHKSDLRREIMATLSRLFKECYARNFNFACIFPLKAILRWFTYQCVGSQVLCCLPPTLFDDETWIGFAVYVVFTWNPSVSLEDLDPVFPPFLFAHLHTNGRKVQHTTMFSLGKDGLIGSEHRLVIFYVPRTRFQQELNQCWQISALLSTTIPDHVEIEMCGIRIVYEKDLKELIQTITECSLESPDVHHQRYYQTFENMEKKLSHQAGTSSECIVMEGEEPMKEVDLGYFYSSSQREQESLYEQVPEDLEVPTSQQNIRSDSRYAGSQMNTPTENGHDITSHLIKKYYQGFDPELIYNLCFPPSDIPKGFNNQNEDYSVKIQLPLNSYSKRNWIGLALWASFSINEQSTTPTVQEQDSGVPLLLFCNLETDGGTLEPLYSYQTTNEESKWLHRKRGLIWLSYIPCGWFKNKLNQCSFMEASFGSESRGMRVQKCGLSFVYGKHAEEFELMIEHSAKVFLEDWDLVQEILVEKDAASVETLLDQPITQGSSSHVAPTFVLLDIMAETPFFESHCSISEWKRNLENLLKKFFKVSLVIRLSLMGHQISLLRGFEPNFNYNFCFPRKEIPQWFKFQNSRPEMIIELFDDSWLGFAICVSFTVHENPAAILDNAGSEIHVNLLCHFNINGHCVNSMFRIPKEEFKWKHTGGFIWLTYRTRWSFPNSINQQSHLVITIHSDCPGLEVQRCGINLLYKQNVKEFEQTIIQCLTSFFDDLDPIYEYLGEKYRNKGHANKWATRGSANSNVESQQHKRSKESACHEDIALDSKYRSSDNPLIARMSASSETCSQDVHLYSGKYDQLDFDKNLVYESCFPPTEVLDWFRNHRVGPSTQVQLPPDLFGEDNWIGLALCAYFSYPIYEHPTTFSDNLDTQISQHLICHLETESGSLANPHFYQTTNEEFKWLIDSGRFIWLLYLPRGWFPDQLKHCSSMEALFASDYESLSVQKCGLRLVYRHDEDELKQTINHCKSSLFEYRERDHVHLGYENANKQGQGGESDSGSATSGSSTMVDPLQERLRTPNESDLKDKGKCILNNLSGSFLWEDHK